MVKHCSYGLCSSDSRYPKDGIFFIRFPKPWVDLPKCKRWISSCGRQNFGVKNISNSTYICSLHFIGGNGPTVENPDPVSNKSRESSEESSLKRRRQPSVGTSETSEQSCSKYLRSEILDRSKKSFAEDVQVGKVKTIDIEVENVEAKEIQADEVVANFDIHQDEPSEPVVPRNISRDNIEKSTQTGNEVENPFIRKMQAEIASLKDNLIVAAVRFSSIATNDKKFKFYTGLSLQQFEVLWEFLDENKNCLKVWSGKNSERGVSLPKKRLSPKDQLLICLMRLRCGFLEQDLAYRFNVSQGLVSRIIITWIQYLFHYFKQLDSFPSKEKISKNPQPKVFKRFKNLRVILDGFEVNTQKPQDYREQGNMYSSYKAHSTFKFILGIIPTGGICFVSEAFEGSISDREIFIKSGLFDKLESKDAIMVDKGFNVQDVCNQKCIDVYMPPFLKERPQLTAEEVQLTKNIASARIHVERCVGAMKQFRLLQKTIPKNLIPIISQTVFVISCLVNLREPMVC